MRIKFEKGQQREFIKKVLNLIESPSLKELSNRIGVNYSSLKNYYAGSRLLPDNLFNDLCFLSKFNPKSIEFEFVDNFWGQVKGGKKSRK